MCNSPLPNLATVESLMHCLLGDKVDARASTTGPDLKKPHIAATYVDDDSVVQRVLICELALANSMGAAMSMIHTDVADDATKNGVVAGNILANLQEVLNICVNLFTAGSEERIAFHEVKICNPENPAPAIRQSAKYAIRIPRYTGGIMLAGSV